MKHKNKAYPQKEFRYDLNLLLQKMGRSLAEHGYSDQEWAERAGVHYITIYRITHGITENPYSRTVLAMAQALGMRVQVIQLFKVEKKEVV